MRYGLIFSAGKETRFNSNVPKALSYYNGKCLLDANIEVMKGYCQEVYVVCSQSNEMFFESYSHIVIESGKGCGHAVMQALNQFDFSPNDEVVIAWGDCVLQDGVMCGMCRQYSKERIIIPCKYEIDPYVCIIPTEHRAFAFFSKYGEIFPEGYHDYGCFFGDANTIKEKLLMFHEMHYDKGNDTYTHKHGNEMQFLDLLNDTDILAKVVELSYPTLSFNTIDELNKL